MLFYALQVAGQVQLRHSVAITKFKFGALYITSCTSFVERDILNVPLTTLPVNVGLAISVLITAAAGFTPPRGCPKYVVTQAKCKPARILGRSKLPLNGPRLCRRIGASCPAASAVLR